MEQKSTSARMFGNATLLMFVWFIVAVIYYVAWLLSYSMEQVGLWLWLIAVVGSFIMIWRVSKKWLEVWFVLKPSLLRVTIFMWHLFVFLVTRNIVFNFVISILYAYYSVKRVKALNLTAKETIDEVNDIFKNNSNALYMTSVFYLWYAIRTSFIVETVMYFLDFDYYWALIVLICLFIIAIFGFVRLQYVICVNIFEARMKKELEV